MNRREFAKSMSAFVAGYSLIDWPMNASLSFIPSSETERFNVLDFGAMGNGFTDDTTAFERALARAAITGGTVLIPAGRFPVRRSLRLRNGVALRGLGGDSIIDHPEGEPIVIVCTGIRQARVERISFTGKFAFAVLVDRCSAIGVVDCRITGGTLPWVPSGYCGGIFLTQSNNVTIAGNELSGNGYIGEGVLSSDIQVNGFGYNVSSRGIRIIRNRCRSTDTQCCIAAYDVQRSEIAENTCSGAKTGPNNNNGYGILIYQRTDSPGSCKRNTVVRNWVSETEGSAIYLQKSDYSRVVENTIDNAASVQDDQTLPVAGVALNQSQHGSIANNRITRVGRAGISIASNKPGVGHVEVLDNVISDVNGMGIHLRGLLTDIRIVHNTVRRTRGGIGNYTDDPQDNILVTDNTVSDTLGPSTGIILLNAANSVVRHNKITDSGGYGLAINFRDAASKVDSNTVLRSGRAFGGKYRDVRISRASSSLREKH
jgi:parallel beta helix pectate lyase-like protein/pectate lyase-like protein